MEITPWTIYLWQLADNVQIVIILTSVITSLVAGIAALNGKLQYGSYLNSKSENEEALGQISFGRRMVKWVVIGFTISALIPSSKTIAMMVIIPKIADSKVLQQDVPDLYNAAVEALKDHLKKK